MIRARALSIGLAARDLIVQAISARSRWPRVHSVFSRAIYVVADNKLLVGITSIPLRSELSILIDMDPRSRTQDLRAVVSPGDPVGLENGLIIVGGGLKIDLEDADLYVAEDINDLSCGAVALLDYSDILKRYFGIAHVLGKLYKEDLEIFEKALQIIKPAADRLSRSLSSRVISYDYNDITSSLKQLLGLGRGLTPSGDDLVIGFTSIYNKLFTRCLGLEPIELDLNELLKITAEISAYMLSSASAGYVLEPISRILSLASTGDAKEILDPLLDLIYYGHSSGVMIGAGSLLALITYISIARGSIDNIFQLSTSWYR